MIIAIFPLVLVILGALLYAVASNEKVKELGRLTFACGLLALAFALAQHVVHIG
jgi:Na+/phosphate symporter